MRYEKAVLIGISTTEAFKTVARFEDAGLFDPGLVEMRRTSPGALDVGATFVEVRFAMGKRMEEPIEVTEFAHNRKIAFVYTRWSGSRMSYAFEPQANGGTRVTAVREMPFHGVARIWEPFIAASSRRTVDTFLINLKLSLELEAESRNSARRR